MFNPNKKTVNYIYIYIYIFIYIYIYIKHTHVKKMNSISGWDVFAIRLW